MAVYVCISYPESPDDYDEIPWPDQTPLPQWGETFIDAKRNTPSGDGCYVIEDTCWIYGKDAFGQPEIKYLMTLTTETIDDGHECECECGR